MQKQHPLVHDGIVPHIDLHLQAALTPDKLLQFVSQIPAFFVMGQIDLHEAWVDCRSKVKLDLITFSEKTKQLSMATVCSTVKSLNTPLKIISVNNNSSPAEISHATLPFISIISDSDV